MDEHRITTQRSARYYTLGLAGAATREVWFACHGYAQLAGRFLEKLRVLDDGHRHLVAPEGLSRFYLSESAAERRVGACWMTREDRLAEIDDYVHYLDAVYAAVFARVDRAAVTVHALGYSQGAATVSRWAGMGTARIDRVVLWGGELPPDLDLSKEPAKERLRAGRLTFVYGRSDEFITPKIVETTKQRLREHAIPYREMPFDGGHELNATVLTDLAAS
jgi:predicted esterase